ncbi:MAG TPA: hypothetical protein VLJ61_00145 [Pyrinomonadaceae bacterium]|nr:hypothetical protein [Pyrinomonadaceae bacterium]
MRKAVRRVGSRRALWLVCLLAHALSGLPAAAEQATQRVVCRAGLGETRRQELSAQLRAITGWPGLHFDGDGALDFGADAPRGGSPTARALLTSARGGKNLIILEDASGRDDVAFCRVVEGGWKGGAQGRPAAFVVLIDFTDFSRVSGDADALAAFNAAWGALHEIEHVVNDSVDPKGPGAAGECEAAINAMRRECGLAERAEYFYTPMPGAESGDFKTRFVRLAFERTRDGNKRRRYWLYWDAGLTGGLPDANQVASK